MTTRYLYDYDLTDAVGVGSVAGESIVRLDESTQATVSLEQAINKLAQPIEQGGADFTFSTVTTGAATVVVSLDEKIVQFTISDGAGTKLAMRF